jgi:hypothetical protein
MRRKDKRGRAREAGAPSKWSANTRERGPRFEGAEIRFPPLLNSGVEALQVKGSKNLEKPGILLKKQRY